MGTSGKRFARSLVQTASGRTPAFQRHLGPGAGLGGEVDVAGQQRLQVGRGAAEGDRDPVHPGDPGQALHLHVGRIGAGGAVVHLARVGAGEVDQLRHAAPGRIRADHDAAHVADQPDDPGEVPHRVPGGLRLHRRHAEDALRPSARGCSRPASPPAPRRRRGCRWRRAGSPPRSAGPGGAGRCRRPSASGCRSPRPGSRARRCGSGGRGSAAGPARAPPGGRPNPGSAARAPSIARRGNPRLGHGILHWLAGLHGRSAWKHATEPRRSATPRHAPRVS